MIEIKFRVWCRNLRKMFSWEQLKNNRQVAPFVPVLFNLFEENEDYPLMQYTGLKDKNGKEIYFGDILQTSSDDPETDMWEPDDWGYSTCHEDTNQLGVFFDSWYPTTEEESVFNWEYVEVIGNIYENPELLANPTP